MFAERTPTLHADASVPPLLVVLLARLGRFDEAEEVLRASESALHRSEDLRKLTNLRWTRASLLFERGRRGESLREFEGVRKIYERGGDLLGVLLTQVWIGRILLTLGRRAEGLGVLEAAERTARRAGAGVLVEAARRSRGADLFAQLDDARAAADPPRDKRGVLARLQALRAIAEATAGREAAMRSLLAANAELAVGTDYALDRALGAVAEAALLRARGADAAAEAMLARAQEEAIAGGVDRDVIPALAQRLGGCRLVTAWQHMVTAHATEVLQCHEIVLDGRSHELRAHGEVRLALSRKVVLRRLLYALARDPGRCLAKHELAAAQWGAAYEPHAHDKALWVNLCRLRALVREAGLQVDVQEQGYVLRVPPGFVFVEPIARDSAQA